MCLDHSLPVTRYILGSMSRPCGEIGDPDLDGLFQKLKRLDMNDTV
jgi:hypothetical protein